MPNVVRYIPEDFVVGKRLGRHVNHDPRSRAFAYPEGTGVYTSVKHERKIPVLNQGNLGSCTGNAAEGAIGTSGLFDTVPDNLKPSTGDAKADEDAAISIYSRATILDGYSGSYPPDDTGSDGLSVAKVLKERGLIKSYLHAFSLEAALNALQSQPVIIGINWYQGFDNPDANGLVKISGSIRGGHEVVLDELDAENQLVWATNSWGDSFGINGRFCFSFDTFGRLLAEGGDCTILSPDDAPIPPPPEPTPTPTPDENLLHSLLRRLKAMIKLIEEALGVSGEEEVA